MSDSAGCDAASARGWLEHDGRLLRVRLERPKANIVDAAMVAALDETFAAHAENRDLTAVLLDAAGPNFSFGASVEEHLPDRCAQMLHGLHALIRRLLTYPVPILCAVQGQCLGGGLELALATHRIFAAPDARLGQPEIRLGVFAPAASCLLPERMGRAGAEDLLFSGRALPAEDARAAGLVDVVAERPDAAALGYFETYLAPRSASSLRYAMEAARAAWAQRMGERLDALEKLYLDGLMTTRDAPEGLEAFLAKRVPRWTNA